MAGKHTLPAVVMHIILGHVAIMLQQTAFILGNMCQWKFKRQTHSGTQWLFGETGTL